MFPRQPSHCLLDIAQNNCFDNRMLYDLTENTAVATADDEHTLWVWVGVECEMDDHFLVAELIPFGAPNDVVENQKRCRGH